MTTKFAIKLLRKDGVVADFPLIDERDFVEEPIFQRGSYSDTINDVKVQYIKRIADAYETISYLWWYQPSVDIKDGIIGIVPMRYEGESSTDGIAGLIYDVSSNQWKTRGTVNIAILYGEPNTARFGGSSNYLAYYCLCTRDWDWMGNPGDPEYGKAYGRLYVFESGQDPRYTDVWPYDYYTGDPYEIVEHPNIFNVMDCAGDRIACIAQLYKEDGVRLTDNGNYATQFQLKISEDRGYTFTKQARLPKVIWGGGYYNYAQVRMSEDSSIWIMHMVSTPTSHIVYIYKYNESTGNLDLQWSKNFTADLNGHFVYSGSFDVSDADGQYIKIWLDAGYYTGTRYSVIYSSQDYGENFDTYKHWITDYDLCGGLITSNDQYSCIPSKYMTDGSPYRYGFVVSEDYGETFSEASLEEGISGMSFAYADMQKYYNEIVYVECGEDFGGPTGYQSLLYSDDNGLTWIRIESPINLDDVDSPVYIIED